MSDIYSKYAYKSPYGTRNKVDALAPYVGQAVQERAQKLDLMQPVKWIFDILNRGQYLTANVTEEIIRSVRDQEPLGQAAMDAISGAMEGVTGRKKGDWTEVLFGGTTQLRDNPEGSEFEGLFPETPLPTWAKKVIGFAADVLLDPTTYISFGATKAATAGAQKLGREALSEGLQSMGKLDVLQKIAGKTVGPEDVGKALEGVGGNIQQALNKMYKGSYKKGLRGTPENIAEITAKYGQEVGSHVGERAMKLGPFGIGQELFKGQRYPIQTQLWDKLGDAIGATKVGKNLASAWWAVNNKGPLGAFRKAFGIRDPFGKYVNDLSQSTMKLQEAESGMYFKKISDIFKGESPETVHAAQSKIMLDEMMENEGRKNKLFAGAPFWNPDPMAGFQGEMQKIATTLNDEVLGFADPTAMNTLVGKLKDLTDEFAITGHKAEAAGAITQFNERLNYLPNVTAEMPGVAHAGQFKGAEVPAFNKKRSYTQAERMGQEKSYIKWLFGVDDVQADKLVREKGLGNLVSDPQQMLMYRALGDARLKKRIAIVEEFKKFGIPIEEGKDIFLNQKLLRPTEGLRPVAGEAFKGLLFPNEVADVLEKVGVYTADQGLQYMKRLWNGFTGWWKGFVTMTTGFHSRNFIQNEITGFMHHGVSWFNPAESRDGLIAAIYALSKDNPKPLLENFALKFDVYQRTLNKRLQGGMTVKEMGDYMYNKGIISHVSQAFDPESWIKGTGTLNPMSRSFVGAKGSRKLGEIIENSARAQNFLMDFKAATSQGADFVKGRLAEYMSPEDLQKLGTFDEAGAALEFAKSETKKWFFDYADLTNFEKKVMRNIIPFYSWLRNNIPAQLATIWTDPSIYSLLPKGQNAITMEGIPEAEVPEWMRQAGYVPILKDQDGQPVFWSPNMAYLDLNKIPILFEGGVPTGAISESIDDIMGAAHPLIKNIVQMIPQKGYDVFFKKDLDYNAPAPYLLGFLSKAPAVLSFLDGITRVLGFDTGMDFNYDKESGKLKMDAKWAKFLEDNLPILRAFERILMVGNATIPGLEQAIEGATGAKDKYSGMEQFFQIISYWGGLKFKKADLEAEKQRIGDEVLAAAQEKKSKAEQGTPLAKTRSLKYQSTQAKKRAKYGL